MSHRPIRFVGIHGTHQLWHADETIAMTVTGRKVHIKNYPTGHFFSSAEDFISTFQALLGPPIAMTGMDTSHKAAELHERVQAGTGLPAKSSQ